MIIRTTLDQRLQKAAEEALADVFATKVQDGSKAQAAIVVMSSDGAVRAMVGGRKIEQAGVVQPRHAGAAPDRVRLSSPSSMPPPSTLGYSAADFVDDSPLTINIPGSGPWTPVELRPRIPRRRDADRGACANR